MFCIEMKSLTNELHSTLEISIFHCFFYILKTENEWIQIYTDPPPTICQLYYFIDMSHPNEVWLICTFVTHIFSCFWHILKYEPHQIQSHY